MKFFFSRFELSFWSFIEILNKKDMSSFSIFFENSKLVEKILNSKNWWRHLLGLELRHKLKQKKSRKVKNWPSYDGWNFEKWSWHSAHCSNSNSKMKLLFPIKNCLRIAELNETIFASPGHLEVPTKLG